MSTPYQLIAKLVDNSVALGIRARGHQAAVAAGQTKADRRRRLRQREALVAEINGVRAQVSALARQTVRPIPAEIVSLGRRASNELKGAMRSLMQPLSTTVAAEISGGQRQAEAEGLGEAYAFLAEASQAEGGQPRRPPRSPAKRRPAAVAAQATRGRDRRAAQAPEPATLRRPPATRLDEPAPPTQRSRGNDAMPPTVREPRGGNGLSDEADGERYRGAQHHGVGIQRNLLDTQSVKRWANRSQHNEPQRLARRQFGRMAAPAFAVAFDRAVPAAALVRLTAAQPGLDTAKARALFVRLATGRFATEFVRLIGGLRSGTPEKAVLNAIIAAAIAEAAQRTGIVPPAAIPAMTDIVFKTLSSSLPTLAKLVLIAVGVQTARPPAPRREAQPEAAW